jgi:hypothetical protein
LHSYVSTVLLEDTRLWREALLAEFVVLELSLGSNLLIALSAPPATSRLLLNKATVIYARLANFRRPKPQIVKTVSLANTTLSLEVRHA